MIDRRARPGHPTWVVVVIAVAASIVVAAVTAFALSSYEGANNDRILCEALNGGRRSIRVYVVKPLDRKVVTPIEEFIRMQPGDDAAELAAILREGRTAIIAGRSHLQSIPCP